MRKSSVPFCQKLSPMAVGTLRPISARASLTSVPGKRKKMCSRSLPYMPRAPSSEGQYFHVLPSGQSMGSSMAGPSMRQSQRDPRSIAL